MLAGRGTEYRERCGSSVAVCTTFANPYAPAAEFVSVSTRLLNPMVGLVRRNTEYPRFALSLVVLTTYIVHKAEILFKVEVVRTTKEGLAIHP